MSRPITNSFPSVKLPSLKDVKGASNVTSTTDIEDFCKFFDKASDDDVLQGEAKCTSNNDKALEGEEGGDESSGSGGSSSNNSNDDEDAAGVLNVNMAVLGLAVVFGVAQLL